MVSDFKNDVVTNLPDITSISFTRIDKKYLKVIIINFFLVFVSLFIGLVVLQQFVFSESINAFKFTIYLSFTTFFAIIFLYLLSF